MLKALIRLASILDSKGLVKEADVLDKAIRKMAEEEEEEEEGGEGYDQATEDYFHNRGYGKNRWDHLRDEPDGDNPRVQPFQSELKRKTPKIFRYIKLIDDIGASIQGSEGSRSRSIHYVDDPRRGLDPYEAGNYPGEDYLQMEVLLFRISNGEILVLTDEAEKRAGAFRQVPEDNTYSWAEVESIQKMVDLVREDPSVVIPHETPFREPIQSGPFGR
jgi:hypothetical protein